MDVIDVAAGLVFRTGRLLITRRAAGSHLEGLWEFPGGKREPGETFEACLARELQEELGVEVVVGALLESLTHAYPEKTVRIDFYRCALRKNEPQALGCADFKWVDRPQLRHFQFPSADARLLERLQTDVGLWSD
jgi:8-oxo-dGTP diphosphatase